MTSAVFDKMQSVLLADFDTAMPNIMLPNNDGSYHLFGLFDVQEQAGVVEVYRANAMTKMRAKTLSDLVRMVTIAKLSS